MALVILWSLSSPRPTDAQMAVAEVMAPSIFAQAVSTVANTLQLVQASIAELAVLVHLNEVMRVLGTASAMLGTLNNLANDFQQFSRDWDVLMGRTPEITSAEAWALWNYQASGLAAKCATRAEAAQNLLVDAIQTMEDARMLIGLISSLSGSLSALQLINAQMTTMITGLMRADAQASVYRRAMMNPIMIQMMNEHAAYALSQARLADWGMMGPVPNFLP